jgi:pimeloyl-ACP methyl ester carboxylesterase
MEMSRAMTGLPLGFLIWHRFDNSARLAEIAARGPAKISIFHGTDDEIIPVSMSHKLAGTHPRTITLQEIPQGLHNSLQETHAPEIAAAMSDIGNKP